MGAPVIRVINYHLTDLGANVAVNIAIRQGLEGIGECTARDSRGLAFSLSC